VTLALCYEAAGKTATAWVIFGEALALAERDKRADRVKLAKEHIASLENRLSYLTIEVPPEGIGSLEFSMTRDGASVARAALGTASAVDPGKHVINVSAPGFVSAVIEVDVGADGDRKKVIITPLVRVPEKPIDPPPDDKPADKPVDKLIEKPPPEIVPPPKDQPNGGMHSGKIAALTLGAVSLGAVGVGGYFGLRAKSEHDEAIRLCPQSPCPNLSGIEQNENAKGSAAYSSGFFVGGLVGLAGSVILWAVSPSHASPVRTPPSTVSVLPVVRPGGAGAFVVGSF
jgi:hypothetical protein